MTLRPAWMALAGFAFVIATALLLALPLPGAAQTCAGDCSGDGFVTVDEILVTVQIALGNQSLEECPPADSDATGTATVDDVLRAVAVALSGCGSTTPTPPPTVGPTPTAAVDAIGTRRFDLDPTRSELRVVDRVTPPFTVRRVAALRGMSGGQAEDGFLVLRGGVPTREGIATLDLIDGSDFFFADGTAEINQVLCLEPEYPAERVGIVDCDGGADAGIELVLDHKPGQLGVENVTVASCAALGGTIESPHQVCANVEMLGEACRSAADCNPNGLCGVATATCTRGREGAACRDDATCDTGPGLLDGICGIEDPHPGICNAPLRMNQLRTGSDPGDAVLAPLTIAGQAVTGIPTRLTIEEQLPCGDEGEGELIMLALTTGLFHTTLIDFSLSEFNAIVDESGENFTCANWPDADGGAFVFAIPRVHGRFDQFDIIYAGSLVAR